MVSPLQAEDLSKHHLEACRRRRRCHARTCSARWVRGALARRSDRSAHPTEESPQIVGSHVWHEEHMVGDLLEHICVNCIATAEGDDAPNLPLLPRLERVELRFPVV